MKYKINYSTTFSKEFKKLDRFTQKMIKNWIQKHLMDCDNPRYIGKALAGRFKGLWRYRIGNYRLIVKIEDDELLILFVDIGHRRDIYN